MADLDGENGRRSAGLAKVSRITGIAAIILAVAELLPTVGGFLMTEPVVDAVGSAGISLFFRVLWIVGLVATAVVAAGLIVGWRQERLLWTPGIGLVASGLVLRWAWWFADKYMDPWDFGRFTGVDADDPDLIRTVNIAGWTSTAIAAAVVILLVWGGILLLRRRPGA